MNQEFDEYNTHSLFFGSHMKSCSLLFSKHIEISNTPKVKEDKIINHSIHKLNTNAARVLILQEMKILKTLHLLRL